MPVLKYKNKETGEWVAVGGGGSNVAPPDWNQNDPEAQDYVKNRPGGYYEKSFKSILSETECTFELGKHPYKDDMYAIRLSDYGVDGYDSNLYDSSDVRPIVRFTVDDKAYEQAYDSSYGFSPTVEIPFGLWFDPMEGYPVFYTPVDVGTCMVCIDKATVSTVTIPEKFLPDTVKAQSDWAQNDETAPDYVKNRPGGYYENVYSTVFEEATVDFTFYKNTNQYAAWLDGDFVFNLVDSGTVVKVIFDGVEYVKTFDDYFGFEPDDTIPFGFKISVAEPVGLKIYTAIEGDTHTVEISKAEQSPIVIPEEFLPDSVATKPSMTRITLSASSWDATALTQSVSVNGISADETAQIIQCSPYGASMTTAVASGIYCSGQAADSLTFTCTSVPTEDIQFTVSWQDCMWIAPLISFTIVSNGVYESYQAEEGMTWEEWVNSSYNTGGLALHDDATFVWNSDGSKYLYYLHHSVRPTEQIDSTDEYRYVNPL